MQDILKQYVHRQATAIQTIRAVSGMFNPNYAVDILALVNQISRVEEGDLDRETFEHLCQLKYPKMHLKTKLHGFADKETLDEVVEVLCPVEMKNPELTGCVLVRSSVGTLIVNKESLHDIN